MYKHKFLLLWSWLVMVVTDWMPDLPLVMRFRGKLLSIGIRSCGKDFQVGRGVMLKGLENMYFGEHVYLAPGVVILAGTRVSIEDEVMVAFYSVVTDGNHTILGESYRFGGRINKEIVIKHGAWIGAHCTLLPGVTVGRGAVVGANSAVTKDIPDFSIFGGVPAKLLRAEEHANDISGYSQSTLPKS